ncbi:MAG TPA: DNA gyrase subunit A [Firmicutes bacterium]|nr:DNA gyrase subunit A [Bacillota bacterium]
MATLGKVLPVLIEEEMQRSYIDYSMSVIVSRALPDVRDGLKPAQRRILWAMYEMGLEPGKPYKKCARVVGEVLGKYHPHGDQAVYETLVRMAQDFAARYPLVDGQGNYGSVDGDPAAAMRYTEARLTHLAMQMVADIEKETVDFGENFDGEYKEPLVLPSRFPNLLANGSAGIAVGMATNIPPHNLGEVIDGVLAMIERPEITSEELMQYIPGPDFPTAGLILDREGIKEAYTTGRGLLTLRAQVKVETERGRTRLVVTELPYQVNKARLVEKIAELVREKQIEGITDLRDESDRQGMRVVIELRKDASPKVILNHLYRRTALQQTFGVIMLALVDGVPEILTLREMVRHYLEHQRTVIVRRTRYELARAEERAHILEGLRIALSHLDEVIKIIRSSPTVDKARTGLMERFRLSERQANAILDMRLQRLTALERNKIEEEYQGLLKDIEYYRAVLADEAMVYRIIRKELSDIKEKYGDRRRTHIVPTPDEPTLEELVEHEEVVVTLTRDGYIKRQPLDAYRSQRRGGRGIVGTATREDDSVESLVVTDTLDHLLLFSNQGRMYRLRVHEVPEAGRYAKGQAVAGLVPLSGEEQVAAMIAVREFADDRFLFFATRRGLVKKTPLPEYESARRTGLTALQLEEGDELLGVRLTGGEDEIFLATRRGQLLRFPETDVRPMGRVARGVTGISLEPGDEVVSLTVYRKGAALLVVTAGGFAKRVAPEEFSVHHRGGKGIRATRVSKRNGPVVAIRMVGKGDEALLISSAGIVIRVKTEEMPLQGRDAQGVTLMRLDEGDEVAALAIITARVQS